MNLDFKIDQNGDELRVSLDGYLNSQTAQGFSDALIPALTGINTLRLDMTKLQFISSAGLRIMFKAHQVLGKDAKIVVVKPSAEVLDVFSITGFDKMLTIE